jgi:hypothetical protein
VEIVRSGPRTSADASGFGSKVSKWLGPPSSQTNTQRFALPNVRVPEWPGCGSAAGPPAHKPSVAKLPIHKLSRRDIMERCSDMSDSLQGPTRVQHGLNAILGRQS